MKEIKSLEDIKGLTSEELVRTPQGNRGIFIDTIKDVFGRYTVRIVEFFQCNGDVTLTRYNEGRDNSLYQSGIEPDFDSSKYWSRVVSGGSD